MPGSHHQPWPAVCDWNGINDERPSLSCRDAGVDGFGAGFDKLKQDGARVVFSSTPAALTSIPNVTGLRSMGQSTCSKTLAIPSQRLFVGIGLLSLFRP